MRRWIILGACGAAVLVVAAVLATRGGGDKPALRAIGALSAASCFETIPGAREVRIPAGSGAPLVGAVAGAGDTGVVLAHQADASLCQWSTYAGFLAHKGYRVLAFDFAPAAGADVPADDASVAAAAKTLRALGAKRIVLMGASRGGTAVLSAARLTDADGIVALSPPAEYNGSDGIAGVKAFHGPLLLAVGAADTEFSSGVAGLAQLAVSHAKRLIVDEGNQAHGVDLLLEPYASSNVDAAVLRLLHSV